MGAARFVGLGLIAAGVLSNLLVICVNQGRMPARTDEIPPEHANGYKIMDDQTRLAFLADWIPVKDWLVSPGDVGLYAGLTLVIAERVFG